MGHAGRNLVLGVAAVIAVGWVVDNADATPPAGKGPAARFVKPVAGTFTSGFGTRWGEMHGGIDIAAPIGTPIRSVTRGTVTTAGPASGFGLWVKVRHPDGTVTVYGHMNTITAGVGERVSAGEQIATVGSRGQSTGPHLHLEVWPHGVRSQRVDPLAWLAAHGIRY